MKRYIRASRQTDLYDIALDMFNDLLENNYQAFKNHEADDIIYEALPSYLATGETLTDIEKMTIVSLIYDIVDDYFSKYFGEASRNKYGTKIDEAYHGKIITKQLAKIRDRYPSIGLKVVQDEIGLPPSTTISALEGMCYNNEACEINDSEYFIGSYAEYNNWRA